LPEEGVQYSDQRAQPQERKRGYIVTSGEKFMGYLEQVALERPDALFRPAIWKIVVGAAAGAQHEMPGELSPAVSIAPRGKSSSQAEEA
jgi:hypothetical protein